MWNENCATSNKDLAVLQTQMEFVQKEISEFKEDSKASDKLLHKKIDNFITTAEDKFASKTVEKVVYWMVAVILTAVIWWVLSLIIIN